MWRYLLCLVGLSTYPILSAGAAQAGVIGSLNSAEDRELSAKIESLYMVLIANGSVPVERYIVQPGDRIEQVLRDRGAIEGPYFPRVVDSLTCDLNPDACSRELNLAQPTSKADVVSVDSLLQLEISEGDWSRLMPGDEILIPAVSIDTTLSAYEVVRPAGTSLEELISDNPACGSKVLPAEDCPSYVDWLNYSFPDASDIKLTSTVQLPKLDYTVAVPSDCETLCAVLSRPVGVDVVSNRFTTQPYKLFSNDREVVFSEPLVLPVTPNTVLPDFKVLPDFTKSAGKVALPSDVIKRMEIGNELVKSTKWLEHVKAAPFSSLDQFDESQMDLLAAIDFPLEEAEELRQRISETGVMPSVMIIDSFFDAKHCDMPEDFVVFDCGSKVNRDLDMCPIIGGDLSGLPELSLGMARASIAPAANALPHSDGLVPRERERCGASGRFHTETVQNTEVFVRPRHGTHLAGLIASRWDKFGVGGINPLAKIVGVQVDMDNLTDEGYGRWLLRALGRIMFKQQVHLVNLSLGFRPAEIEDDGNGEERREWLSELITKHTGVLFVAAAGNDKEQEGCDLTPACLALTRDNVVTVVALNGAGTKVLGGMNSNPQFAVGAGGEGVMSTLPLNLYGTMRGSSQSAAIVSGAISLAYALGVRWTPAETRARLIACSTLSRDLMGNMIGGRIDVGCLIDKDRDRVVDNNKDVLGLELIRLTRGGNPASDLAFFDIRTRRVETIDLASIVGFQRIGDDVDDVVFFSQPPSGPMDRREGAIEPGQELVFLDGGQFRKINAREVVKFTRAAK